MRATLVESLIVPPMPASPSPGAGTDPTPPIDLAHLSAQTFGDRDLQAELLALFARQAQGILDALQVSLAAKSSVGKTHPRPADLLHTLCGSARAVGSWRVADEAEAMERDLRRPDTVPALHGCDRLAALKRSVGQVCAAIDGLSQAGPG